MDVKEERWAGPDTAPPEQGDRSPERRSERAEETEGKRKRRTSRSGRVRGEYKSPVVTAVLSLMPGLGQVFVGYYQRGFINITVVASLMALTTSGQTGVLEPFFIFFTVFFWMYNVIDAGRLASLYNRALEGGEEMDLPDTIQAPSIGGSLAGGVVLIVAGFLLLMHTRFGVSMAWMQEWWPLIPVGIGVYLIYKHMKWRQSEDI